MKKQGTKKKQPALPRYETRVPATVGKKIAGLSQDDLEGMIAFAGDIFETAITRIMQRADEIDQAREERRYAHEERLEAIREQRELAREARQEARETAREERYRTGQTK